MYFTVKLKMFLGKIDSARDHIGLSFSNELDIT